MRIFLSYPSELKATAEPIAFSLRSRGHKVFLDKDDLPAGRSYDEQIQKAIEGSDVLIYLISPASVEKGRFTLTEMEFARAAWAHPANRVLPVMIEPTDMMKIPSFLKGVTILKPHGNVTAEVAAAAERLRGPRYARGQFCKAAALAAPVFAAAFFVLRPVVEQILDRIPTSGLLGWLFWDYILAFPLAAGVAIVTVIWRLKSLPPDQAALSLVVFAAVMLVGLAIVQATGTGPFRTIDSTAFGQGPDAVLLDEASGAPKTELTDEQKEAVKQINSTNASLDLINFAVRLILTGLAGAVAAMAAASAVTAELRSARRWPLTILGSILAIVPAYAAAMLVIVTDPASTVVINIALAIAGGIWAALVGGMLGYWLAVGQDT